MEVITNNWSFSMTKDEAVTLTDLYRAWDSYCVTQHDCHACCMYDICGDAPTLERFANLIQEHITIKEN